MADKDSLIKQFSLLNRLIMMTMTQWPEEHDYSVFRCWRSAANDSQHESMAPSPWK